MSMKKITIKYLTFEEFEKLIKAEQDHKFKLAYALGFGSGLRISEIVGLKNSDGSWKIKPLTKEQVNLQAHQIMVRGGKGCKDRITSTSPYIESETKLKMLPLNIPRRTLQGKIKRLGKRVLDRDISFHSLRHSFANYMINEKNLPLPMAQAMLGHSELQTTGIYTKVNPKEATDKAFKMWD